jgi:hypothetical protein
LRLAAFGGRHAEVAGKFEIDDRERSGHGFSLGLS